MKARVWLLGAVAAVAAVVAGANPARADDPVAKSAGPFVVIVGAGEFQDKAITPLPSADADAKALFDVFTDPKYLGVPAARAKLLLSAPDEKRGGAVATRENITKAIEAATAQTGKDDLIVLAFFGRGASLGDKTVLLTPDTVFKDRAKAALVFGTDLEPAFKKVKGQRVLMLMDVHYKGFDPGAEKVAEPTLQDVDALLFGAEDKEDSVRPQDRLMILGGFLSTQTLQKGDHGLFAATLIDALKGAADTAPMHEGYEPDGLITTDELVKYLEKEVPNQARQIGKTDKEKEQQPVPIGATTSHFAVTRNPAESDKVLKRLTKLTEMADGGTVNAEVAKEGATLLFRMPKLKAHQELRKHYQKLVDGAETVADFTAARKTIKDGLTLPKRDADGYAKKVNDAVELVTEVYIKAVDAGDLTAAAIRGMFRRIDEPLPADLDEALKKPKGLAEDKRLELLKDARLRLGKREDLDENKDVDVSILMMLASLNDPYTVYYDKESVRKAASQLRGRFPGVGIQIRRDAVRDGLLVVTPIKSSPAYGGGIQAGDLIIEIRRDVDNEGKPLPADATKVFSTKGMKTDDAIAIITGKPDTPITLVVQREGEKEPLVFNLKRNWVSVETVLGTKRKENTDWTYYVDEDYKIAYIHLTQFTQSTFPELKKAVEGLKKSGLNGLVLDLRFNPGGYLTSAKDICELFVGPEKIVTVKPRPDGGAGRPRVYAGDKKGETGFPMVVLVNSQSASASEIVAACLQDHGRAIIVGERSYGKGSVQDVVPFRATEGEIKLTIARYYPPSDRNIDKLATGGATGEEWGVKPDKGFEVALSREELTELGEAMRNLEIIRPKNAPAKDAKAFEDKQLNKALEYLRDQIKAVGKAPPTKKDG